MITTYNIIHININIKYKNETIESRRKNRYVK